jgi:hypothetical protein
MRVDVPPCAGLCLVKAVEALISGRSALGTSSPSTGDMPVLRGRCSIRCDAISRVRMSGSPLFEADHMTPGRRGRRDQGHLAGFACSSASQGRDRPHRQTIANKGDDNYDVSSDFLAGLRGVRSIAST